VEIVGTERKTCHLQSIKRIYVCICVWIDSLFLRQGGSCSVTQAGLKLEILLPQLPSARITRCVPPQLTAFFFGWVGHGLNSGLQACKAGILPLKPHLHSYIFKNKTNLKQLWSCMILHKCFITKWKHQKQNVEWTWTIFLRWSHVIWDQSRNIGKPFED
jgi:hypothetical protein